ncbi:LTA synthase family protein [Bombilactobacillus folatiphilus]|uniref:LTA synthase family protein n=1 Tax=Bombilactobacillus folatiphilus TaxID=2923362 RepID=A0ABY4P9N6_9LACO|nr:LTA synthase family protein [Bombilactobacillus folatiphilus]UQS82443.1 LTA synthase family protein [Bombilactobacillus folatiphilus]
MQNLNVKRILYHLVQVFLVLAVAGFFYIECQLALTGSLTHGYQALFRDMSLSPLTVRLNLLFLVVLITTLIAIIGDYWWGLATSISLLTIFLYVNFQKIVSRSEPLVPSDLQMVGQTKGLTHMVSWQSILVLVGFIVVLMILAFFLRKWTKTFWCQRHVIVWSTRIVVVLVGVVTFGLLSQAGDADSFVGRQLTVRGILNNENHQLANYYNHGTIIGFAFEIRSTPMTKPAHYNQQTMKAVASRYRRHLATTNHGKKTQKVNIVYILNESLTNPQRTQSMYPIAGNKNPMPYISGILNHPNHTEASGYMVSPGFGGGTANIEFEANTGFSNYFLRSTPYQDILPHKLYFPSVFHYLKGEGYTSKAYHPYTGIMYRRTQAYPALGIKTFKDQDKLKGLKTTQFGQYATDESAYTNFNQQQKSTKQMSLMITMQNHMPYDAKVGVKSAYKLQHSIKGDVTKTQKLQTYFQEVNESDQAFKKLVQHFQDSKQKTLIVMYGDHYPGDGIYDDLLAKNTLYSHTTPFVMAANFPLKTHHYDYFSPNYMSWHLLEQLNYPQTPFYQLLGQLYQQVPVLTQSLQMDTSDLQKLKQQGHDNLNYRVSSSESKQWTHSKAYKDYRLVEYDMTYGKSYAKKYGMFDVK